VLSRRSAFGSKAQTTSNADPRAYRLQRRFAALCGCKTFTCLPSALTLRNHTEFFLCGCGSVEGCGTDFGRDPRRKEVG